MTWKDEMFANFDKIEAAIVNVYQHHLSFSSVVALLLAIIETAEDVVTGPDRGSDKKAAVFEVIDNIKDRFDFYVWIDDMIRLPGFLEAFDGMVIRSVIDHAIDMIVAIMNSRVWRD